jgi:hypothetical protein
MSEPAYKARLALEGSTRGAAAVQDLLAYISDIIAGFEDDNLSDAEAEMINFLALLEEALDPASGAAIQLVFQPRGPGAPARPENKRARESSARLAAFFADRWYGRGSGPEGQPVKLKKTASSLAAEMWGVTVSEIYAVRKKSVSGFHERARSAVKKAKTSK